MTGTAAVDLEKNSRNGLSALEVKRLQARPFWSVDGFEFGRGEVAMSGLALPPGGDPSNVSAEADSGIAFEFDYPLPHPDAANLIWYWPGVEMSAYRIRIDLARTRHVGDYYKLRLKFAGGPDDDLEALRTTFVIPKHFGRLENYPLQGSLGRVQTFDTISSVAVTGATHARLIVEIAKKYGFRPDGAVLDWGVGHGRVARFLREFGVTGRICGVDIDPTNIAWAREHLPKIDFVAGPLMPPLPYPDASFDLVFGISMMTHLARDVQDAWLGEIKRILTPGGIALLTFKGDSSVAFTSSYLNREWMDEYYETGVGRYLTDGSLVGVIENADYYKNVNIRLANVEKICAEQLEVVGSHECVFGHQDLVVLRR